jgi:hypothetical protein
MARGGKRLGAGRPRRAKRVGVLVRMLPETLREIDRRAFKSEDSRGVVIDKKFLGSKRAVELSRWSEEHFGVDVPAK